MNWKKAGEWLAAVGMGIAGGSATMASELGEVRESLRAVAASIERVDQRVAVVERSTADLRRFVETLDLEEEGEGAQAE